MNSRSLLLRMATAATMLATANTILAAGPSHWKAPDNPIQLNFNAETKERRLAMTEEGEVWEITLEFHMIKYAEVAIVADLPNAGRFQIEQDNADALVDVKDVHVEGRRAGARLVGRLPPPLSAAEARRRAQESINEIWGPVYKQFIEESKSHAREELLDYAKENNLRLPAKRPATMDELHDWYATDRAAKKLAPDLRRGLTEVAGRKPQWVTSRDKARWAKIENHYLFTDYINLLEHEIIDDYLNQCKLGCETNNSNFRNRLDARLNALHLIVSGKVSEGGAELAGIAKGLGPQEITAIRNALAVHLRCRFFPETDPADPNAQWFQGQRVSCRARGVASIRLEGRLDPSKHDSVDWWLLEGYDPAGVVMSVPEKGPFRIEPPVTTERGAALRVVATGKEATDYAVEFRPTGRSRGNLKVIIYESPNTANTKFPY